MKSLQIAWEAKGQRETDTYRKKMTEEAKASGISAELTDTDTPLEQIIEMFEESDREGGGNSQQVEQNKANKRKQSRANEESVNGKAGRDTEKEGS